MKSIPADLLIGLDVGLMPPETLVALMHAHRRHPWQRLGFFGFDRFGPPDRYTIYDFDAPRRDPEFHPILAKGLSEEAWFACSQVRNVPRKPMRANSDNVQPGFRAVLNTLLNSGCIRPGAALDRWLLTPSRAQCVPDMRLFYIRENEYER